MQDNNAASPRWRFPKCGRAGQRTLLRDTRTFSETGQAWERKKKHDNVPAKIGQFLVDTLKSHVFERQVEAVEEAGFGETDKTA